MHIRNLMKRFLSVIAILAISIAVIPALGVRADSTAQTVPFTQNWSNTGLITTSDSWTGVPGIMGYRGDNLTPSTGTDPQTILADDTPGVIDVNANQTDPIGFTTGGVAEFELTNPAVALSGSGTADAPYILINLDTTGKTLIQVSYQLRDLDGSGDNAIQQVAMHYRVGSSGTFTNVPAAYVADATEGGTATLVTPVNVTLPGAAENQALVQIRIMTTNAVGNDEWVGIDNISITGNDTSSPNLSINDVSTPEGDSGSTTATFTVTLASPAPTGGVVFDIATADNTATVADNDYAASSVVSATIAEGSSTYTFTVDIQGDTNIETDEAFWVNITNVSRATVVDGQGQGSIANDDAVIPALSLNDVSQAEGNAGTSTFTFTATLSAPAPAGGVTFDIATADGSATVANSDYVANSITNTLMISGTTTYTFTVSVVGDVVAESDETFSVTVTNLSPGIILADGEGIGTILNDDILITPIYAIQGDGPATPLSGVHTTEGIVIGDFEGGTSPQIRGFYLQDATGDGNPATSDGIFVYDGGNDFISLGDHVRVTGTVGEYQGQTQISSVTTIWVLSSGNTLTPTAITLPFASTAEREQYEDMLVVVNQPLYVTEHYLLGRFGQVTLSGSDRLYQPTNVVLPGAPAAALQVANDLNRIILDDASQSQNPDPILFGRGGNPLSASNTLRGGDTITGLVGVFDYTWGGNSSSPNAYRIRPINALGGSIPNFVAVNARPATPSPVGGSLKVAGMNLLNYYNTFDGLPDTVDNCTNGVGGIASDCRGADDLAEFVRQADKIVNAIVTMDADVLGIVEIENDGYASDSAIQDLVDRLNAATAPDTFAFLDVDAQTGITNALGTDGIKVGLIYQPDTVTPIGETSVLDTIEFVNGGDNEPRNRVSLLQAFEEIASGEQFAVDVNHLKSKGSACDDPDAGDGQGNCNLVRTNAVNELTAWLATDPTGTGDPDVVILGDLNSYAKEDPIAAFENSGYTNLVNFFNGSEAYSYVFDGQWGYLDYAISSPSLLAQVSGVTEWHINADEPSVLDYNTNFKSPGQIISLYSSEPFRTADHDPIMVGLNLNVNTPDALSIHKSVSTAEHVAPGSTVTYTIALSNTTTNPALGVVLTDALPPMVSFGGWLENNGAIEAGGLITWTGGLAPESGLTLSFTATVSLEASHDEIVTNVAHYTYATSQGHALATFTVYLPPVLGIEKSVYPHADVAPGDTLTYTIQLANTSPTLAPAVMLTDTLPAEVIFGAWVSNAGAAITDGEITWSGSIAAETTLTLVFTASVSSEAVHEQVVTNTAVYAYTYGTGQASTNFVVDLPPALSLEKSVTPAANVAPGARVTYTIQLVNTTPTLASSIMLTDALPSEVSFGGWISNPGVTINDGLITWSGSLGGNASLTLVFTAVVSAETSHEQIVTNTATYTFADGSGQDAASFTVYQPPALSIEKSVAPASDVTPGSTVTYTIRLNNTSPTLATGITLTDVLPAEVTFDAWVFNTGANVADGVITWVGSLGGDASLTLIFTAVVSEQVIDGQVITNTASYTQVYGNGQAAASFVVLAQYRVFLPIVVR